MGLKSKPKKEEYEASEAEKTEARISAAEYTDYKENMEPILMESKEASKKDFTQTLKDRSGADFAQAEKLSLGNTTNFSLAADTARIATRGMLAAATTGKEARDTARTNALASGRKQATVAQGGLAQIARQNTRGLIAEATNKQTVRNANAAAIGTIIGAVGKAEYAKRLADIEG